MNRIASTLRSQPRTAASVSLSFTGTLPPGMALKTLAAATAMALAVLPDPSYGQSIGALDVRSRPGERFFAAVPVRTADGIIDPRCIRIAANPNAPAGAEALEGTHIRVGSADTVIIETAGTVMSPVVGLRLEVGCENPVRRDFVVLDPSAALASPAAADGTAASQAAAPATPAAAASPAAARPAPRAQTPAEPRARRAAVPAPARVRPAEPAPAQVAPAPPVPSASAGSAAAAPDNARRVADLRARSDDHAAALLALDDRLALLQKQAELLKLQLEQRLGVAAASASAAGGAASISATVSTPSASSTAKAATDTTSAAGSAAPAADAATPSAIAAPATAPAPAPAASAQASPAPAPVQTSSVRSQSMLDLLTDWKVAGGLAALLLGALAFKLRRRPTFKPTPAAPASAAAWPPAAADSTPLHQRTQEVPVFAQPPRPADTGEWQATTRPLMVDQTAEWVAPPTTDSLPLPESGSTPPAALPGAAMTREFHITQQFQPAAERVVALSSPEEIVQQARTHYMEDNDVFKAIDLLEMAVSARKDSSRPWQALFAIYRRENMPERYQRLVLAYRGVFGQDEAWPAIRALGHQIDPTNPLYGDDAGAQQIPEDLVERWLGVPLDFTAHLLANEMHDQLMDTYSGRKRRQRRASE